MERDLVVTIAGMCVILVVMRLGGYVLVRRLPPSRLLDAWLGVVPGVTLVALVVPAIAREGLVGIVAAGLAWLIVMRTGNIIAAMIAGVAIVALFG